MDVKNFKNSIYLRGSALGIGIYIGWVVIVAVLGSIIGLKTEGTIHGIYQAINYTLGFPNLISVYITGALGMNTSPYLLVVLILNLVTYSVTGVGLLHLYSYFKKKK